MPFPIFSSIASWLLKKRYHQINLFLNHPEDVQLEVLNQLIITAKQTKIGREYDFWSIKNYEIFKSRVPVRSYEEIHHLIERSRRGETNVFWPTPIKWFAKSSGTTNAKSKFVPVSDEALEDCHFKSGKDLLCLYLNNNSNSELFKGKALRLGGNKEIYKENGTYFGDLSSILIDNLPFWAEISSTPSNKVSLMKEWESKLRSVIRETIYQNITSLVGVPSWMLVLLNEIKNQTNLKHLHLLWPNVEVYFHGGINFEPYKNEYRVLFPEEKFKYYEVYNASEGFFAIQDRNNSSEMLLMLDYGIFYEFVDLKDIADVSSKAIPIWEVKEQVNYAMIITTNSGLWRYFIGDTIKFVSRVPYRIKITGRVKHFINVFGEELIIENVEIAIRYASERTKSQVVEYTVAPIFMKAGKTGGHQWLIEFKKEPILKEKFMQYLDKELKELNSDYEAKRYNDITIAFPKIEIAKKGLFYKWLKKYNKLGGQHKVPRLLNERSLINELMKMNV